MREFLTALAAILVLVLLAALVGPRFVDWETQRAHIDARLSQALGLPVRSEGALSISILPAPTARFEAIRVGRPEDPSPSARIRGLSVELDLLSLLQREVHINELDIRTIDARIPTDEAGIPLLAANGARTGTDWNVAIDRLAIADGAVSLVRPDGQARAMSGLALTADAASLLGPWRGQGSISGVAIRFSTGEMSGDNPLRLIAIAGGESHPRLEFDGTIGREVSGTAKLSAGPPVQPADSGAPVPIVITGALKGPPSGIMISNIRLDVADGPASLRFEGDGMARLAPEPQLDLNFHARFIDADAFLVSPSGQAFLRGGGRGFGVWPVETTIGLKVDTVTLGNEETGSLEARVKLNENGAALTSLSAVLPGKSQVRFTGVENSSVTNLFGRLTIDSADSDALAGFLAQINGPANAARVAGGKPFKATTDIIATREVVAARGLDWSSGPARITGNLRYTPAETEAGRARLQAQLRSYAFDLATLPDLAGLRRGLSDVDVDIALDASQVGYGSSGPDATGTLQVRLNADKDGLTVNDLDIANLAGASARASGRISNQGEGRIEGSIGAARVGPLLSLAAKVWGGDTLVAELPNAVGEAPLDARFAVVASNASAERALVATLSGMSASMRVEGEGAFSRDERGALEGLATADLRLAATNSLDLLRLAALDTPNLPPAPGEALVSLRRAPGLGLAATLRARDGNWSVATLSPIPLRGRVGTEQEGSFRVAVADATPWLQAWQLVPPGPERRPLAMDVKVRPAAGRWMLEPDGRIGEVPLKAVLTVNPASNTVSGTVDIGSASLPALATWAGLVPTAPAQPGTIWSIARFPQIAPMPFNAEVTVRAAAVDLGQGRTGRNGEATLLMGPESISLRPFRVEYGEIGLSGDLSANRQGARAALAGEIVVTDLFALDPAVRTIASGRMPGRIRFGTAGETPTSMVANLSGAGQVTWEDLSILKLAPSAPFAVAAAGATAEGDLPSPDQARRALDRALDRGPFAPIERRKEAPATITGGVMRIGPFIGETPEGRINLQMTFDLRSLAMEGRASLQANAAPRGWVGGAPQIALTWKGQAGQPTLAREIDPAPLLNGLAALRLSREVEKIEQLEADDRERAFFNRRLRAERERNQPPPAPPAPPAPSPAASEPSQRSEPAQRLAPLGRPIPILPLSPSNAAPPGQGWSPPPLPPPIVIQP